MITLTVQELMDVTQATLVGDKSLASLSVTELVTDSRIFDCNETEHAGTAFLALKGANFDAQRFVPQVVAQGCKVVVVAKAESALAQANVAQLVVADTRIALGEIAAYVKQQVAPKTVGITGSSGKTTVKEMVAAILSRLGNVLATLGNFNNDIGVPLTLLRLNNSHDFAVIEMGANHMGEIAYTTALVKPDVAVINNIAAAHLEGFGDLCGVARAKGEIFSGLGDNGVALYNQDTKYTNKWQWRLEGKTTRTFSCVNQADCYSSDVSLDELGCADFTLHTHQGNCQVKLNIPGKHNVCNAVAAASIALEFGASLEDIRLGLAKMQPVKGRLNLHQLASRVKLIDDSYNANLESAKAAAQLLSSYPGKTILILGDMGELGSEARSYHQEVGEFAQQLDIEHLLTLGVLSQSASDGFNANNDLANGQHFNQRDCLLKALFSLLNSVLENTEQEVAILVKGSRSAHMEKVAQAIITWFEQAKNTQSQEEVS